MTTAPDPGALRALRCYAIADPAITPIDNGLINRTWRVIDAGGTRYILQRLNAIFDPQINNDIAAVAAHLARKGVLCAQLVNTIDARLWVERPDGIWRVLSFIEGDTRAALTGPAQARSAGVLLGRFHHALRDYSAPFASQRPGVHDLQRHLRILEDALRSHSDHPRFATIAGLAREILDAARFLAPLPDLPLHVVHGDPKTTNLLFRHGGDEALSIVDLDTLARTPIVLDLGDALRSWCNPRGDDVPDTEFSEDFADAALAGYASAVGDLLSPREWQAIFPATLRICVELAARFCADALNESYFGWDARRFSSRGEHNEVRARGQLALAQSLRSNCPV